jgi:hypothetical protein
MTRCKPDLAEQDSTSSRSWGRVRVEVDGDNMTLWSVGDEGLMYLAES